VKCPREFLCCKSKSKSLCKVKDTGIKGYVEIEEIPLSANFQHLFERGIFVNALFVFTSLGILGSKKHS
jgi:hypothetical protein